MDNKQTIIIYDTVNLIISTFVFALVIALLFDMEQRILLIPIIVSLGGIMNMIAGARKGLGQCRNRAILFWAIGILLELNAVFLIIQIWRVG